MKKMHLLLFAVALAAAFVFAGAIQAHAQAGGEATVVKVTEETFFSFTPNATGYWTFEISDSVNSDHVLWIYNPYGVLLEPEGAGLHTDSAVATVHLVSGAEYIVYAGLWGGGDGFTLTVTWSDEYTPPPRDDTADGRFDIIAGDGGSITGDYTGNVLFTPDDSGFWHMALTGFADAWPLDKELFILDSRRNEIAGTFSDESGAICEMTVHLTAGESYIITYWVWPDGVDWWEMDDMDIMSTLTITRSATFEPWMDADYVNWMTGKELNLESVDGKIPPAGGTVEINDPTWLTFTPDATGIWIFSTANNTGDPYLLLTDAHGSFLAHDDDSAGRLNARLEIALAEGVEYRVGALFYWDGYGESYTLTAAMAGAEADDDDGYVTLPASGESIPLEIWSGLTFRFSPPVSGYWVIEHGGDADVVLSDASGSFTTWTHSWRGGAQMTIYLAAGHVYVLEAYAYNDGFLQIFPFEQIRPVQGATTERQVITDTRFTFVPPESGIWAIRTTENSGDPYLRVLNAAGEVLASDDDNGGNLNALVKIELTAGNHYYIDAGFFVGGGSYVLILTPPGAHTNQSFTVLPPPVNPGGANPRG